MLLAGLCLLLIGLTFRNITADPLNWDEAFSFNLAAMPWKLAWSAAVADASNPPIFTMVVKLWMALGGQSLLWLRLLPSIAGCLLLVPFFLLVEEFNIPGEAAVLALAAMLANETRMYYTHILRCYGLLLLFSAFSIWLFARNSRMKRVTAAQTAAYWIVNLWMCWMHYFGLWVAGIEFLLALVVYRKELARTIVGGCIVGASFLFWVPGAVHAASSRGGLNGYIGWIAQPTLRDLARFYHALLGVPGAGRLMPVGSLLFALPLLFWCIKAAKRPGEMPAGGNRILVHLLPYVTVPVLATFLLSRFGSIHMFSDWVLIFAVVPYCLLIGAAVARIPMRPLKVGASCALFVWAACGVFAAAAATPNLDVRWDLIAGCVADPSGPPLPVRAVDLPIARTYGAYLRTSGQSADRVALVPSFRSAMPDRFWAGYLAYKDRPAYNAGLASDLQAGGYATVRRCTAFGGVGNSFRVVFDLESRDAEGKARF
jgi:hypothetical protein